MKHIGKVAYLAVSAILFFTEAAPDSDIQHGMDMSFLAYDLVCWYLSAKQLYFDKSARWDYDGNCGIGPQNVKGNLGQFNDDREMLLKYFGQITKSIAMNWLPHEYGDVCNAYLEDPKKAAPSDESDVLNDNETGDYPWKGFSYCMIQQLRNMFGEKAIQAVNDEKTHGHKDWRQTILDQDNAYRAHHGTEPFKMDSELNAAAQKWADHLASKCKELTQDSHSSSEIRHFRGSGSGENLNGGSEGADQAALAAYRASNAWYKEVDNYPDKGTVGHFTQTVWRSSTNVGYGFAVGDCGNAYFVGRYFPQGNVQGEDEYKKNVLPAIS
ncbi:unnamed protein product [Orchesella dallaii]|uniref:SCP domain-containing protein n=1 Tax=Orchesella dallaii TaxID=48710 RepID=A0ABP1RJ06_9HEXA